MIIFLSIVFQHLEEHTPYRNSSKDDLVYTECPFQFLHQLGIFATHLDTRSSQLWEKCVALRFWHLWEIAEFLEYWQAPFRWRNILISENFAN